MSALQRNGVLSTCQQANAKDTPPLNGHRIVDFQQNMTSAEQDVNGDQESTQTCLFCMGTFSRQYALTRHLKRKHKQNNQDENGIVSCPVWDCSERISDVKDLAKHWSIHHQYDTPVHCNYCGCMCSGKDTLRIHVQHVHWEQFILSGS